MNLVKLSYRLHESRARGHTRVILTTFIKSEGHFVDEV